MDGGPSARRPQTAQVANDREVLETWNRWLERYLNYVRIIINGSVGNLYNKSLYFVCWETTYLMKTDLGTISIPAVRACLKCQLDGAKYGLAVRRE